MNLGLALVSGGLAIGAFCIVGDYTAECGKSALVSVGIGLIDGTAYTGVGALVDAAGGCLEGVAAPAFNDLTSSEAGTDLGTTKDLYDLGEAVGEAY